VKTSKYAICSYQTIVGDKKEGKGEMCGKFQKTIAKNKKQEK
jgi:hypothetical protein